MSNNNCEHNNFQCFTRVGRLTDGEHGPVTSFTLDIKVQCTECKDFFEFVGVPNGSSPSRPMASVDFTELRAPIRPNTGALARSLSYTIKEDKNTDPIN